VSDYRVKELMVPLSEYATVPEGSTLFDAVLALEKAQEEFDHTKYKHRGVLILDKKNRVIGKLGQLDVLRALEPKDEDPGEIKELSQFGFSSNFVHKLRKQRRMKATPLKDLCGKASKLKVGNGDVRAESALQISSFVKFNTYAKISQIRCPRDFASCHGPGYRTKKDIHKRYGPQRFH
jgi:hypothetical protein